MRRMSDDRPFEILVNDRERLYAAKLPDKPVPDGWRVSHQRQFVFAEKGYLYAPPWEVYPGEAEEYEQT